MSMSWVVGMKLCFMFFFNLYRGMWRYTGLNDLFNVGKAMTLGSLSIVVLVLYLNRFEGVSRSVFIIDWCFSLILIMTLRICTRLAFEQFSKEISFQNIFWAVAGMFKKRSPTSKGVLIIGAGDCGEKICREIREDASLKYHVQGFLDDDPAKAGRQIHGVPVLDRIDRVGFVARSREVEYRDLLGRKPVELDKERIGNYLAGRTVVVSGAGGSIGQGLCRQVCQYSPKSLVLLERAESPLYEIDLELRNEFPNIAIIPMLADIQERDEIEKIFKRFKPEIVFHAAAYKHVPMLEAHPAKAIANNIGGTENMVYAAHKFKCDRFVFVSTDKAVNPANIMGASKRVAELIVQNHHLRHPSDTRFITVRFGNVIGSVGSVIPLFKKQIKAGGPVTVTHPDMVRFFMLIPEACQLILQAGAMGKGGEIFVLEMGNPVKIDDMARDLIRLSGFEPEQDISIEYTGLRPGEKLYEELMTAQENVIPTDHRKIMVLNGETFDMDFIYEQIDQLKAVSMHQDRDQIVRMLKTIVPEYQP